MLNKIFILLENIKEFLAKKYRIILHHYKYTYVKLKKGETMPYGVGTYGSKRGRPPKSAKMKKQSAVAIAKKKKMKKKK